MLDVYNELVFTPIGTQVSGETGNVLCQLQILHCLHLPFLLSDKFHDKMSNAKH